MLVGSLVACLLLSWFGGDVSAADELPPNIVFFLVDDMGWMDTTVNGSRYYETPNMERLAERGMVFTDAYTANPLCSPTRASIMTGKYPARLRITTPAGHLKPLPDDPLIPQEGPPNQKWLIPRSKRFLAAEEYTIAEALRDAGYRTAHLGKWHLGVNPEHWPEAQGFEVSFHGAPDRARGVTSRPTSSRPARSPTVPRGSTLPTGLPKRQSGSSRPTATAPSF